MDSRCHWRGGYNLMVVVGEVYFSNVSNVDQFAKFLSWFSTCK
jgi:hypothetical protein